MRAHSLSSEAPLRIRKTPLSFQCCSHTCILLRIRRRIYFCQDIIWQWTLNRLWRALQAMPRSKEKEKSHKLDVNTLRHIKTGKILLYRIYQQPNMLRMSCSEWASLGSQDKAPEQESFQPEAVRCANTGRLPGETRWGSRSFWASLRQGCTESRCISTRTSEGSSTRHLLRYIRRCSSHCTCLYSYQRIPNRLKRRKLQSQKWIFDFEPCSHLMMWRNSKRWARSKFRTVRLFWCAFDCWDISLILQSN